MNWQCTPACSAYLCPHLTTPINSTQCGRKCNRVMLMTCRPLTIHSQSLPMQEIKEYSMVWANETEIHRSWCFGSHARRHKLGDNITSNQWCCDNYPRKKRSAVPTTHPTIIGSSFLSMLWKYQKLGYLRAKELSYQLYWKHILWQRVNDCREKVL